MPLTPRSKSIALNARLRALAFCYSAPITSMIVVWSVSTARNEQSPPREEPGSFRPVTDTLQFKNAYYNCSAVPKRLISQQGPAMTKVFANDGPKAYASAFLHSPCPIQQLTLTVAILLRQFILLCIRSVIAIALDAESVMGRP